LEIFSLLLLLGIVAGILAGLLGVGGGIIIVPTLVWIFHNQPEKPNAIIMQIAIGTSLATISITSISSIIAHHRYGAVQWQIVWQFTPGIIIGALFGAFIAGALTSNTLQKIFALFVILISIQFFLTTPTSRAQLPKHLYLVGIFIGQISALVGIGGGSLTVPFLVWCKISIRNAIATSAACGFPIAFFGTIGFIATGWNTKGLPTWSSGYIYWPAFVAITPMTLLFAQLGAKLAHGIPINALKKIFAIFLVMVGIKMLFA
jgi:uncharacterized membrane protein YfcA